MKQAQVLYRDWPTLEIEVMRESPYAFNGGYTFGQI